MADGHGALALNDLPSLALARVLELTGGPFRQEERLSRLCLVCRRWYDLCHSPALLHRIVAILPRWRSASFPSFSEAEQGFLSFQAWMARHGSKVTELTIALFPVEPHLTKKQYLKLQRLAFACLPPCAAPGARLERLDVTMPPGPVKLPALLGTLSTLRWLEVGSAGGDLAPLSALTGLCHLELTHAHKLTVPRCGLPSALTSLRLSVRDGVALPDCRLVGLTALRSLNLSTHTGVDVNLLSTSALPASACNALTALSHLTRLCLCGFEELPAGLGARLASLTQLQVLHLETLGAELYDDFATAEFGVDLCQTLPALQQLRALILYNVLPLHGPPAELAQLPLLRGLQLASAMWEADDHCLPAGPWLTRLERLSCHWELLSASQEALAPAATPCLTHLMPVFFNEELRTHPNSIWGLDEFWRWLWAWAGEHPALRQLEFDENDETDEAGTVDPHRSVSTAMKRLQRKRPEMCIDVSTSSCFWESLGSTANI